ncbi:MAG: DNA polymerase III subunit epsilon [Phycicoccus sp.]|nr:DNA polymerase III subunit epsilon [Phycicoccus sp.]
MYAVIDTETTGLSPRLHHRVVELAVVLVDERGQIESEFCTLLNPERDLGPQHIHGIRAADVINAPRFTDVAGHLLGLLSGRTIVAHNLPFDLTFLDAEFDRLGVPFPLTRDMGVCTMTWSSQFLENSGRSLRECCAAANVPLTGWHSALSDTRAAAGLLRHYISASAGEPPWQEMLHRNREVLWPKFDISPFQACSRSAAPKAPALSDALVSRLVDFMPRVDSSDVADPYLAVLDEALVDRCISTDEQSALAALASSLGLTAIDVARLHRDYLNALARVALADGHLSKEEASDLQQVAKILGLPEAAVSEALAKAGVDRVVRPTEGRLPLEPGDMIVFTGDMAESRELWMKRAAEHGYVPHPCVTKKVRLVVAADTDSLSGKAKKARGYGIPVMSVDDFRTALGYPSPAPGEFAASRDWGNSESQWAKALRNEAGK